VGVLIQEFTLPSTIASPEQYSGAIIYVLKAAADLSIQAKGADGNRTISSDFVPQSGKFKVKDGFVNFSVQFTDTPLGAGTVVLAICDSEDDFSAFIIGGTITAVVPAGTDLAETPDVVTPGGARVTSLSVANAGRKAVIITSLNGNNAAGVRIGKLPGAAAGSPLYPGQSITLETQAGIQVYDGVGGNTFTIQEILL
jgi:hypothetical protein